MPVRSSGETAVVTTADTAVAAIPDDGAGGTHLRICNEGAAPGFYSTDGGTTWLRLPAGNAVTDDDVKGMKGVQVKRVASGENLSSVFVTVW